MCRHQSDGLLGVTAERGIHDGLMLVADPARLARERHGEAAIALALVVELAVEPQQPGAAAALHQGQMERGMGGGPFVVRAHRIVGRALGRAREAMEGGDQPSLPVDIAEFDGAPQAEGFDLDPHPGEVAEILGRDRRRAKAALGLRHHQPLGCQPRERLADRAQADGEPGAEILNLEAASRKDAAGQEVRAQILIGALGEVEGGVARHWLSAGKAPAGESIYYLWHGARLS